MLWPLDQIITTLDPINEDSSSSLVRRIIVLRVNADNAASFP